MKLNWVKQIFWSSNPHIPPIPSKSFCLQKISKMTHNVRDHFCFLNYVILTKQFLQLTLSWKSFFSNNFSFLLQETVTTDALACHNFCQKVPECSWFTFFGTSSVCLALSNCTELNTEDYPVKYMLWARLWTWLKRL